MVLAEEKPELVVSGKGRLLVYHWALLAGLKEPA